MSVHSRGAISAIFVGVLALCSILPSTFSDAAVPLLSLLLVATVAIGWPRLLELPSRVGTSVALLVAGVGAIAAVQFSPLIHVTDRLVLVLAAGTFVAFMHQMFRHERSRLTESITGTVTGVVIVALGSGWTLLARSGRTGDLFTRQADVHAITVAAAAAIAVATLMAGLPLLGTVRLGLAALLGAGVSAAVAAIAASPHFGLLAVLGLVLGFVVVTLRLLLDSSERENETLTMLASAAVPVLACGMVVYLGASVAGTA